MSFMAKLKSFFELDNSEYEYIEEEIVEDDYDALPSTKQKKKQNVVSLQSLQHSSTKVILVEPRVYDEVQEIADHLKNRKSIVINLQRVHHDQAVRIVDFLSGTVYAIGGDIKKLGTNTFLCTPENVDISGSISEMMTEHNAAEKGW